MYIHLTNYLQVVLVDASSEHYLPNLNNTMNQSNLPSINLMNGFWPVLEKLPIVLVDGWYAVIVT